MEYRMIYGLMISTHGTEEYAIITNPQFYGGKGSQKMSCMFV